METKGLPLDFILMSLEQEKYVIDWLEFIQISLEHNWKVKGTLIKIENSLIDVYGKNKYTETVINRLSILFGE